MPEEYVYLDPKDMGTDKDPLHRAWVKLQKRREYNAKNTVVKRLHRRLLEMGEDVEEPKRFYHGHHQRSAGAWSWEARYKDGNGSIGSAYSMWDCLRMTQEDLDMALE